MLGIRSRFGSVGTALTVAASLAVAACGDDGTTVTMEDLVVTTATTGLDIPSGGYEVVVEDLGTRTVGASGSVTFESIPTGSYLVELTGIPGNCTVAGDNPRNVATAAGGTTSAGRFEITCVPNRGTLEVTVTSGGVDAPESYTLALGETVNEAVSANGVTVIDPAPGGDLTAHLVLPANCTAQGENPRTVAVPVAGVGATAFEVTCVLNEGALEVVTETGGVDLDPDGYTVTVAETLSEAIDLNDAVTFTALTPGDVVVELTGLAANCAVDGDNPRTVNVAVGDTTSTTFEVVCEPGGLHVTAETSGFDFPAGFTVSVDGAPDQTVGPNETVVFASLPSGVYDVELKDLPGHCEVVDGPNPREVTASSTTFEVTCWAWLVFDSDRTGNFDVFIMRHDGSEQTNLTSGVVQDDRQPVVSPDGTKIAFVSERNGNEHIWVMDRDGGSPVQLTFNSSSPDSVNRAKEPSWSPDGTKIVFSARRGSSDQWDIWVMDADGDNQVNLTNDSPSDGRPEWSPDGKLIFDSAGQIYTMNANGSGRAAVPDGLGGNATWSPDGEWIAFTGPGIGAPGSCLGAESPMDVWKTRPDGSGRTNLTKFGGAEDGEAAWSRDGTAIAFMSARPGGTCAEREIYLMDTDGGNVRQLTDNGSADMWPSWAPPIP